MDRANAFAQCLSYLNRQLETRGRPARMEYPLRKAVAISRQAGTDADSIAEKLAEYIQLNGTADAQPWTVLDKDLMTKVLEDQHLPARLAEFLPEDEINAIRDAVDEILGLHPPSWLIIHESAQTILRLAELGNVILVGRGAAVITRRMPNVVRVRLVGSIEQRLARVQQSEGLNREEALSFIRRTDRGRARYVKKYFHQDVADVMLYGLTINTDDLPERQIVQMMGDLILDRIHSVQSELRRAA